jgi:hypothetical protein
MYEGHLKFLDWAAQYDEGLLGGRSKSRHEAWIKTLRCPVLRIDGTESTEVSMIKILELMLLSRLVD